MNNTVIPSEENISEPPQVQEAKTWRVLFLVALTILNILSWGFYFIKDTDGQAVEDVSNKEIASDGVDTSISEEYQISNAKLSNKNVQFTLNTQDFSYPEKSVEVVRRAIELHEKYEIPLDISFTGPQVDIFEKLAPDLFDYFKASELITVNYHVRPPYPYDNLDAFDTIDLADKDLSSQLSTVIDYEDNDIDLATGQQSSTPGGYTRLKELIGYAPTTVGAESTSALHAAVNGAFKQLGATFTIRHGNAVNVGDKTDDMYIRPEHYDLKLFHEVENNSGKTAQQLIEEAFTASATEDAKAPYFVGIKMHDNDFFAVDSAWLTVYLDDSNKNGKPPYDLSPKSELLSTEQTDSMWQMYESMLVFIDNNTDLYTPQNSRTVKSNL